MFPRKQKNLIEAGEGEKRERNINAIRNKKENKKQTKKHIEYKKINQINKFLIKYIQYITHYIISTVQYYLIKMSINK